MGCSSSRQVGADSSLHPVVAERIRDPKGVVDLTQPEDGRGAPAFPALEAFPMPVLRQTAVTELRLTRNDLTSLPDAISALVNLRILDVAENRLATLPGSIGALYKLEELDASENEITELPSEMGTLRLLRRLIMYKNRMTQLPSELCTCEALEEVNFFNNKLIRVPPSLERLEKLDNVNFGGNRLKTFLKPAAWKNATRLALMSNTIVTLPSFEGMTNLRQLQLGQTVIDELPKLGHMPKLQLLDASRSCLVSLPAELGSLPDLRSLAASDNKLVAIPPQLGASRTLTTLNLANNSITVIPDELGNCESLKVLLMRKNKLSAVPGALLRLGKIERIDVELNPLEFRDAETKETLRALRAVCVDKKGFCKAPPGF